MATEKRLIFLEDAIERIVNFPSKVAHDNFYGKKQFSPMQMLNVIAERQHEIIDLLETVKTVDAVEVVHGRWEKAEYNGFARCDQCKDVYINEEWLEDGKWNYCPNCGAKMDGDGNGL